MESIINLIKSLFGTYGVKVATIVLLTILFVNLIKKPIVLAAEKYATKNNCDKSIITRYLCFLPFVIAFLISLIWELILTNFDFSIIDYELLFTNVLLYGSLSIATFETLKLQFEAYATKKELKKAEKDKLSVNNEIEKNKNIVKNEEIL